MKLLLSLLLFSISLAGLAAPSGHTSGDFSGRVSKINKKASFIRIHTKFANMKYINKKDRVEFWNDMNPEIRCRSYVIGKSPEYLLLKVSDFDYCLKRLFIGNGGYLKFFSQDLVNNLKMGKEVMSILLKKQIAISGRLNESKRNIENYLDRVDAINNRYKLLREQLELEWQNEIASLEEDRSTDLQNYKALQIRLSEIEHKIEQYKMQDDNFEIDRWALDSRLYFKK